MNMLNRMSVLPSFYHCPSIVFSKEWEMYNLIFMWKLKNTTYFFTTICGENIKHLRMHSHDIPDVEGC